VGFNTRIVPGPAELAEAAAAWTAERIASAVGVRGACYLALAGGETPRGCYERLAQPPHRDALPWPSLFVYWSDERQVPLDDASSNYAMAGDPTAALRRIPADTGGRPRFDLIHLGLGEDGHTASLFPNSPAVQEARALVAHVHDAPKPPPDRVTLTLPVLNAGRAVLFMVQGASKREALARVLRRDPALPASHVQPLDGELQFIVDRAAAGG